MDWIGLIQDRDRWRTLVSAVNTKTTLLWDERPCSVSGTYCSSGETCCLLFYFGGPWIKDICLEGKREEACLSEGSKITGGTVVLSKEHGDGRRYRLPLAA